MNKERPEQNTGVITNLKEVTYPDRTQRVVIGTTMNGLRKCVLKSPGR